ncbi:MAG: type II toxin-antitoxin system HicB family antitoxin [Clostridiales bacterium]|nr:type II toxin-antitoxin system HicB family antitoxin [Clostridiales bacterium]
MSKYVYAAIFTKEENGAYSVAFNDVKGCYSCGDTLEEAIEMAEDALALVLYEYEREGKKIHKPTDISKIETNENEFVTYIACDTIEY